MGARIFGVAELAEAIAYLDEVPDHVRARVLTRKAKDLLQQATEKAPTDGDPSDDARPDYQKLRESGRVLRRRAGRVVRFATRHAAAQHERMDWQHEDGGQPKFLEEPLRAMRPGLMQELATEAAAMMARIAARARRGSGRRSASRGTAAPPIRVPPLRDGRGRFVGSEE